jgi:predicted deacetylase
MLVSIHDVMPGHVKRIERAERLLVAAKIDRVTYLLVPNFHGVAPIERHASFRAWCQAPRPFGVDWVLHGYFHDAAVAGLTATRNATLRERIAARLLTAGEGEFQTLTASGTYDRLVNGCRAFQSCIGWQPGGFVAPAWLFNEDLFAALKRCGIRFTESHTTIWDLHAGSAVPCPVITWSSRSATRRAVSRMVSRFLVDRWRTSPAVRVALHPADFDAPGTTAAIAHVLHTLRQGHECGGYQELFDGVADGPATLIRNRRLR